MITPLPLWINLLFIACVVFSILFFYLSNKNSIQYVIIILIIAFIQSIAAYSGFYLNTEAFPPRFILVLAPTFVLFFLAFRNNKIETILNYRRTKVSTFLHLVRIPVEIVLLHLFLNDMIPQLMTFEGRNYDILAGITAIIVGALHYKDRISKRFMILWNYIGLALIFFIVINGLLSSELPFQQFAFDQPNRAVLYFPFVLLPAVVVPIVIFTHITDIMKLRRNN